jgi:hypothetical protein
MSATLHTAQIAQRILDTLFGGQILMLLPVYAREVSAALICGYEVRNIAYQ